MFLHEGACCQVSCSLFFYFRTGAASDDRCNGRFRVPTFGIAASRPSGTSDSACGLRLCLWRRGLLRRTCLCPQYGTDSRTGHRRVCYPGVGSMQGDTCWRVRTRQEPLLLCSFTCVYLDPHEAGCYLYTPISPTCFVLFSLLVVKRVLSRVRVFPR